MGSESLTSPGGQPASSEKTVATEDWCDVNKLSGRCVGQTYVDEIHFLLTVLTALAERLDEVGCETRIRRACRVDNDIDLEMVSQKVYQLCGAYLLSLRRTASFTAVSSLRSTRTTLTPSFDKLRTWSSDRTAAVIFVALTGPLG